MDQPDRPDRAELTPLTFLERAAYAFGERVALVSGERRFTYRQFRERVHRLATALRAAGIQPGDRVAVLALNGPAALESHYGVPLAGAILVAINTRLSQHEIRYILRDSEARALLVDTELAPQVAPILADCPAIQTLVSIREADADNPLPASLDYEAFLAGGHADAGPPQLPHGEETPISINYTSGTTGQPKGVVYTHRGAYLNALSVAFELRLGPDSVYLWTLPMFHCNGWCYTWGVTAAGGTHVALRRVDPPHVWDLIEREGVTHLCGAPTVVISLANDPSARSQPARRGVPVRFATGGAPPSPTTIAQMSDLGVEVLHLYGLTETYGPSLTCAWWPEWNALPPPEQARIKARQGVPPVAVEGVRVVDEQMRDVPRDASTLGEVVVRGNTVMAGYYRDPEATAAAFRGGWFHTGDLGVVHSDGYIELRDRAKDVIISGGENISTIEVEQVLLRHAAVLEAAVVGTPDDRWGEVPKAFVTLKPGANVAAEELIDFCRQHMAHFKAPRSIAFGDLPKTSTGKIQKFVLRAAEWQGRETRIR
ncbi:MAG TPA: acyl--CoA ligase family protein [Chloroflexota bacterium]